MYIKNVDALEQLRDLVIGIKELPYIKKGCYTWFFFN